jgi:hypothetical protein
MGAGTGVGGRLMVRVRQWFADLGLAQIRRLIVVAVLAVTALFGGLDGVETNVTVFEPGDEFDDGQYTWVIDRAALVDEVTAGSRTVLAPREGRQYVGIVTGVTNNGTIPGRLGDALDLRGHPGQRFVGAYLMSDSTPLLTLGPGLTAQVAFFWDLPRGSSGNALAPDESLTLRVWKKKFTELGVTYGQDWVDSLTDYGEVTLPVRGTR